MAGPGNPGKPHPRKPLNPPQLQGRPFEVEPTQALPVGGRLRHYGRTWVASIKDWWVVNTVSNGHAWRFTTPPGDRFRETRLPKAVAQQEILKTYVTDLFRQAAVAEVPMEERGKGVYSPLFLVQKANGQWRPVLDLTYLNHFITKEKFRMESLQTIALCVQPSDWMISIDLKDAYFHVPIAQSHQRFLRCAVGKRHFQFTCLPFGLTTSPRVFSKLLLAIVALLRQEGVRLFHYLDDLLLLAQERQQLVQHRDRALQTLQAFGWLVNREKSHLEPSQDLVYLGARFHTVQASISLPEAKLQSLQAQFRRARAASYLPARDCLRIIGLMSSSIPMVRWARWHMRPFQVGFLRRWSSRSLGQRIHISPPMRSALHWWQDRGNLANCPSLLPPSWVSVTTDASEVGWGALCLGHVAQGTWTTPSAGLVSNVLELRAAHEALKAFDHLLEGKEVLLKMDNTTAVAYVRRQGGTRSQSLLAEVAPIMVRAQRSFRSLSATYIPGVDNTQADFLSRHLVSNNEWSLHPEVFQAIAALSPVLEMDLFASAANHKLSRYLSRARDRGSCGQDALSSPWAFNWAYAFPPVPLILRFLRRLSTESVQVVAILPFWPNRPWFPLLALLSTRPSLPLPDRPDLLSQGTLLHPAPACLHLRAWWLKGRG